MSQTVYLLDLPMSIKKILKVYNLPIPTYKCFGCGGVVWKTVRKTKCPTCGSTRKDKHILYIRGKYSEHWNRKCKKAMKTIKLLSVNEI